MMCGLVAAAFSRFGCAWSSRVLLVWPSFLTHDPGTLSHSHSLRSLYRGAERQFDYYIVPISTETHWAGLCIRPPCVNRNFWDVVLLDSKRSTAMLDTAHATLLQMCDTCDQRESLWVDGLREVSIEQQADTWSCGPRFAHAVSQCFAADLSVPLVKEHFHFCDLDSIVTGHTACVQGVIRETRPFWAVLPPTNSE